MSEPSEAGDKALQEQLGSRLRALRLSRNESQEALARRAGPLENLAIVALLSQLTFASDAPIGGRFRGRNAPSKDVGWVS